MSEIAIVNRALSMLGANPIISFGDGTVPASVAKLHYETSRDAVLESHEWSFAVKRVSLVPTTTEPAWGNAFTYVKPSGCLRIVEVRSDGRAPNAPNNTLDWTVEGDTIVCDAGAIAVRYISRVQDTTTFTPAFTTALAARLAADMAIAITESTKIQASMYQLATALTDEAKKTDGLQGSSRRITFSKLTSVRYT